MSISHQTFLIKPSSSNCNLHCNYCFYHDIADVRNDVFGYMSKEVIDTFLKKVFDEITGSVNFIFQGGEPLLIGQHMFEYFVQKIEELNINKIPYQLSIQTNGLLIDEDYASFFKRHNILIGISLDGPQRIHNHYRDNSFERVMQAIHILKQKKVEFNILSVVIDQSVEHAKDIYAFFRKEEFAFIQFIPFLEVNKESSSTFAPDPETYGRFLVDIFDLWSKEVYQGTMVSVSNFEDILKNMLQIGGATCGMNGICALNLVLEANGKCIKF